MLMKVNIFTCHWAAEEPCVLTGTGTWLSASPDQFLVISFPQFFSAGYPKPSLPPTICIWSGAVLTKHGGMRRNGILTSFLKIFFVFRLWPFRMERCLPLITHHSLWPWYGREQFNQRVVFTFSYPLNQLLSPRIYVGACTYRYYNNCCYNQQSRFKHHVCNVIKLTAFFCFQTLILNKIE